MKKFFLNKNIYRLLVLTLLALSIFFLFYNITKQDIWSDEAFSINLSQKNLFEIVYYSALDTNPPLHTIVLHFFGYVSNSAFFMRLPSTIAVFGAILVSYRYSIEVFKNKLQQLAFLAMVSVNPLLIYYAQEARSYGLLMLLAVSTVFVLYKSNLNKNPIYKVLFVVVSILGLYTHNLFTIFLFSLFLIEAYFHYKKNKFVKLFNFIKPWLFIFLFYLPWLLVFVIQTWNVTGSGFWLIFEPIRDTLYTYTTFFIGDVYAYRFDDSASLIYWPVVFFSILLNILGLVFVFWKKKLGSTLLLAMYISYFMIGIVSFVVPFMYNRYTFFLTPFVLIITSAAICLLKYIKNKNIRNLFTYFYIIIVILIFKSNLILKLNYIDNYTIKEDYRRLLEQIDFNEESDIILNTQATSYHSLTYYDIHPSYIYNPERDLAYYEGLSYITEDDYFDGSLYNYDRIWIVSKWHNEGPDSLLRSGGYEIKDYEEFKHQLKLTLWQKK